MSPGLGNEYEEGGGGGGCSFSLRGGLPLISLKDRETDANGMGERGKARGVKKEQTRRRFFHILMLHKPGRKTLSGS